MKIKGIFLMLFVVLSLSIFPNIKAFASEKEEKCTLYSTLSRFVMEHRQQNTSKADLLDYGKSKLGAEMNTLFVTFVDGAYQVPVYTKKLDQENAITRFGNDMYLLCLKTIE